MKTQFQRANNRNHRKVQEIAVATISKKDAGG